MKKKFKVLGIVLAVLVVVSVTDFNLKNILAEKNSIISSGEAKEEDKFEIVLLDESTVHVTITGYPNMEMWPQCQLDEILSEFQKGIEYKSIVVDSKMKSFYFSKITRNDIRNFLKNKRKLI